MNKQNSVQQQKMIAIFIFTIAILSLSKGIGNLDKGINFLTGVIIICGALGAIFSIYTFIKSK